MENSNSPKYSSKIIKASALIPDTKLLLGHWDEAISVNQNISKMLQENVFGKATRSRIADMLNIFKQRYLNDDEVRQALIILVKENFPSDAFNKILYFLTLQSDNLLHDVVTLFLNPAVPQGQQEIATAEVRQWTKNQVEEEGKTKLSWSSITLDRVAQHIMATLRDFGILQGKGKKRLVPAYLSPEAFAFIAFLLKRQGIRNDQWLTSPEWSIFFLSVSAVERLFIEAHQEKLLGYYAAGSVVRVEFPVQTIQEYARVLTRRNN